MQVGPSDRGLAYVDIKFKVPFQFYRDRLKYFSSLLLADDHHSHLRAPSVLGTMLLSHCPRMFLMNDKVSHAREWDAQKQQLWRHQRSEVTDSLLESSSLSHYSGHTTTNRERITTCFWGDCVSGYKFFTSKRRTDMQEKLKVKLRDIARRRQDRNATRDLRCSA